MEKKCVHCKNEFANWEKVQIFWREKETGIIYGICDKCEDENERLQDDVEIERICRENNIGEVEIIKMTDLDALGAIEKNKYLRRAFFDDEQNTEEEK